ncbi:hypothetical protein O0L34_g1917 [Tuta absoluta]|nr:hypothetical protein O0L34_g1917 [Tuta absoluta]
MNKLVIIIFLCVTSTFAGRCTKQKTLTVVKKSLNDFSVRFLETVAQATHDNFVYSPLATWLQLVTLAEGAHGNSLQEIWNVTGLTGYREATCYCYIQKFRKFLEDFEDNVANDFKRKSAIVVDKAYTVKDSFKRKVEELNNVNVLSLDFEHRFKASDRVEAVLHEDMKVESSSSSFVWDSEDLLAYVDDDDFVTNVFLMYDAATMKAAWKYGFNESQTRLAPFYYGSPVNVVSLPMMHQIGLFKETEVPHINARVLELPCENGRLSMLIYLPLAGVKTDLYYLLKDMPLSVILTQLEFKEPKTITVSLPMFKLNTEITNVIQVLSDMGLKSVFDPAQAELKNITDSGLISVDYMYQTAIFEVNESNVTNKVESLEPDETVDFNVNKPFAFVMVDKKTELILFAGVYSKPMTEGFVNELF